MARKPGPGRPRVLEETPKKISMLLLNRQIVFLDGIALEIRQQHQKPVNRTEIVRALIDALEQSSLDVTGADTEAKIRELLIKRLKQDSSV